MNETKKTIVFVAVAVAVALVAWIARPSFQVVTATGLVGEELFPDFDDPLKAASLEIVEFDEDTATRRPFKVAQVDGEWSIPSHEDYPADAKDQLGEVAGNMVGLKALDMASDSPGDHKLYGVADPDKVKAGDTGVGTRVTMRDAENKLLMSIIIGEKVPESEGLLYVRTGDQSGFKDPVYTVELKTDKLSTKFEKWIEDDLLKLQTWDVRQVRIHDYSVDTLVRPPIIQRSLMTLDYDDKDSKWKLTEDRVFDRQKGGWTDMELAEDEELDTTKLNDMKWALDDLKIVDVARKPEGLSENLKNTGEVPSEEEAFASLQNRGFYIARVADHYELVSSEGEITILMKDGVEYVLRFGQFAGAGDASAESEEEGGEKEAAEGEDEESDEGGINRYLFVMTQFNPDMIPKPELEPLPGEKTAPETEAAKPEASAEEASEGEAAKPEASEGEASKDEAGNGNGAGDESPEEKTEKPESGEAKADEPPAGEAVAGEAKAAQKEPAEGESSEKESPKKEASEDEASQGEASKDESGDVEKERERIEKENQRKQDEYDEKVKKGKDRVKELNARFADWYYVISDDVYKKIHLSREDVIKKKEKKEDGDKEEAKGADQEKPEPKVTEKPAVEEETEQPIAKEAIEKPATKQEAKEPAAKQKVQPQQPAAKEEAEAKGKEKAAPGEAVEGKTSPAKADVATPEKKDQPAGTPEKPKPEAAKKADP